MTFNYIYDRISGKKGDSTIMTENLEKSIKELEKEKKKNQQKIDLYYERTRMSKVNQLEYKAPITLGFSAISLFVLFIVAIISKELLSTTFLNNISSQAILFATSISMGIIGELSYEKKFKIKERLKDFSSAKTEAEKLQEEINYQIELEKAKNRDNVINKVINSLYANQSTLKNIASKYEIKEKNNLSSKEELEEKQIEMLANINKKYNNLDLYTTKKVLNERFWKVRSKFQRRTEFLVNPMLTGLCFELLVVISNLYTNISMTFNVALTTFITTFLAGITSSSIYMLKRNSDYKKVFNNLNSKLGDDALPEKSDKTYKSAYEEQQELVRLIETQIRDISLAEVQLQENKRYLETFIEKEQEKEEIKKSTFSKSQTTERHIEENLNQTIPNTIEKGHTLSRIRKK